VINRSNADQQKLSCFYVADEFVAVDDKIIKQEIAGRLPSSHLPQVYVAMTELPLTHSGKTDRKTLELFDLKSYFDKPFIAAEVDETDDYEDIIIEIFRQVLQVNNISTDTDFFDAGGDSMSTLFCIAEIETKLKLAINSIAIVANPTPKKLSEYLRKPEQMNLYVERKSLNEYIPGKRNLYLLNQGRDDCYGRFVSTPLAAFFNLIELAYDMNADPEDVINQLVHAIAKQDRCVVIGLSFSGFIAHQLACVLPNITCCVLLDTFDYFDYGKYTDQPQTIKNKLDSLCWHFFINGDFGYPMFVLKRRHEYRQLKKLGLIRKKNYKEREQSRLYVENINRFIARLQQQPTINNCLYFQASRYKRNIGKSWKSKVGGKFYYEKLFCVHSDIIEKEASAIAKFIIKNAKLPE
jgi:acyl carrier protein